MTTRPATLVSAARPAVPAWDLSAPAWANRLVAEASVDVAVAGGLGIEVRATAEASLVTVRVPNAAGLSPADFEQATADAYTAIAGRLAGLPANHPVRFWNYIPGIHQPCGPAAARDAGSAPVALDRYMVFNAGRYTACSRWLGGEQAFPRLLATASGVGHDGADLVIHALAAATPGVAVENPRQVPAYRYSTRYGPRPPCFARATLVTLGDGGDEPVRPIVLVGGTASVRGEESVYVGDVRRQTGETLDNLAALLQAATGDATAGPHRFTDVRVYIVRPADEAVLRPTCERAFSAAALEFVRADICRQDLLVEIEGVAAVGPSEPEPD